MQTTTAQPRRKNLLSKIALIGGGALLFSLLAKGSTVGRLVFFPEKVRGIDFDGATPVLSMGILVQNTGNETITMRSFAGNLFANGILVGNVSSFVPLQINRNAQGVFIVQARLSPLGIVNDIIRAFQYNNFSQDVSLEAFANLDNYQLPVNLNFKIGL